MTKSSISWEVWIGEFLDASEVQYNTLDSKEI
jgi:hypothetical protein